MKRSILDPKAFRPGTYTWVICDRCRGEGTHDHPAFSNGITSGEWAEWDHDERESYMQGAYDVACTECGGSGKVIEPIVARLSFSEKRHLVQLRRSLESQRELNADWRAEQRHMGYEC